MSPARRSPFVHKFGGAALADGTAMRRAAHLVKTHGGAPAVVITSAMCGVTDTLLRVASATDDTTWREEIEAMRVRHHEAALTVSADEATAAALQAAIDAAFASATPTHDAGGRDLVLAIGERLAARLVAAALESEGLVASFVDATELICADGRHGDATPDIAATEQATRERLLPLLQGECVAVVPGFIARAPNGSVVTLGRGGSDLSATLLGRVLRAREVMLWKDVPGMLTADPRIVPDARLIPSLDVREAAELAYHGAKVLHPRALTALGRGTRLRIRPFADPDAAGTRIAAAATVRVPRAQRDGSAAVRVRPVTPALPVKALAAIHDQAMLTLAGNGMMGVPGVAARAFSALEREGISVSIISQASSEHSICIGVTHHAADAAASALEVAFAPQIASGEIDGVEVRRGVATIAIVGSGMAGSPGIAARFFTALADARVNVVAIAQGTSELNISVVIDEADAPAAQRAVHAAFGLSKIGGGTGARHEHADVVLLGFGQIGRALTKQIADSGAHRTARIVGIIDRTGYVFNAKGIGLRRVAALAAAKRAGRSLSALADGITAAPLDALRAIAEHHLSRPILVDVTASDSASLLEAAMALGMDVVLANKKPLADERTGPALSAIASTNGRRLMTEATVGAGLPIIDTIQKLQESGDDVLRIEGCPSGTLGYLFGELGRGVPFSTAVLAAKSLGYTEPDPRDDLSGTDVARKALILGRLLGFEGELRDIRVQSLVPASMASLTDAEFLEQLPSLDASWDRRVRAALARGTVLRYRALVTKKRVVVGVVAMDAASSFGVLTGTDNQFAFTTRRYRTNPLVITGAGAGAAVTAAGVLNDILKLAGAR